MRDSFTNVPLFLFSFIFSIARLFYFIITCPMMAQYMLYALCPIEMARARSGKQFRKSDQHSL